MIPNYRNEGPMDSACQNMPTFFKFLLLLSLLLTALDLLSGGALTFYLANFCKLTIFRFQLWRLVTSFLTDNLINMLFALLACYFMLVPFVTVISHSVKEILHAIHMFRSDCSESADSDGIDSDVVYRVSLGDGDGSVQWTVGGVDDLSL